MTTNARDDKWSGRLMPSKEFFARFLDYCPESGKLTWAYRPKSDFSRTCHYTMWSRKVGDEAGHLEVLESGYRRRFVFINKKNYKAHRIALIMSGTDPKDLVGKDVDHINGDASDNRLKNIRVVERIYNARNTKKNKANSSGVTGVYWSKQMRKWHAQITLKNKRVHLGYFDTVSDAAKVRAIAEHKHGFSERHGYAR